MHASVSPFAPPQVAESALAASDASDAPAQQPLRDELRCLCADADALSRTHGFTAADR